MTNGKLLIKGGRIIDPANRIDAVGDVLIADGRIAQCGGKIADSSAESLDASGKIVCPGLIDIHVHFREPGDDNVENIASGSAAAVAGGFTSVACMPNTRPALDEETHIDFVYRQAAAADLCNVFPVGAITKGRKGEELAEMGQMVRAGAVGFSDDGAPVTQTGTMYRALQYVSMFDRPILQHCEDPDLARGGVMNAGVTATRLGMPGMSPMAEELMIQRDLSLVRETGARYHVCHISTRRAVELVRQAKANGLKVTAEVTPHHLILTETECSSFDTNCKMSPPLRTRADVEACVKGVADGTIDCLATDHAPHAIQQKELEFLDAPFGIIGLESALPVYIRALIDSGALQWPDLIERLTVRPAAILSLNKGTLSVEADADVTVIDPDAAWTIDAAQFASRSRNCPFNGWQVRGRAAATIVNGRIKYQCPKRH